MSRPTHAGQVAIYGNESIDEITRKLNAEAKRIYYLDQHCPGCPQCLPRRPEEEVSDQEVKDVTSQMLTLSVVQKLAAANRATILWFWPYTPELQHEWNQLTDGAPMTSKGLCDFIRKTLTECGFLKWGDQDTGL